jgi:hypothetical protein
MTTIDSCGQATLARVTQIAFIGCPGNVAIVTGATEASVDDIRHREVITANAHLESEFGVANLATEADAVKPMRKYHRAHAFLLRTTVEDHVGIFCRDGRHRTQQRRQKQQQQPTLAGPHHRGGTAPDGIGIGKLGFTTFPGRATLWQRKHSVRGKATAPWQTPHCSPFRMASIDNLVAPVSALNK